MGSLLVCDWPHSVFGQNLLFVKMLYHRDSTIQKCFRVRRFSVPCQPSGRPSHPIRTPFYPLLHPSRRRAIPSGRQTDQASSVRTRYISVRTLHCIEKLLSSLHPSGRLLLLDQSLILSKFQLREDQFDLPNNVVSRPDARILKARITIQMYPSRRQPA
jgi:hypothetical protein